MTLFRRLSIVTHSRQTGGGWRDDTRPATANGADVRNVNDHRDWY